MKKAVFFGGVILVFCVSLLCSLWFCFPWSDAGIWLMNEVRGTAISKGVFMDFGKVDRALFPDAGILVEDISLKYFMSGLDMDKIEIRPGFVTSLLHLKPSFYVKIGKGAISTGNNRCGDFDKGDLVVRISKDHVFMDKIDFSGEISASGHLDVDLSDGRFGPSALDIGVPGAMDDILKVIQVKGVLKRSGAGRWQLVKSE